MLEVGITPQKFKQNLKDLSLLEIKSLLSRFILNSKPNLKDYQQPKLNLGCSHTTFLGWINADIYTFKTGTKPDWTLDLRYPLNCPDNVWYGVFTEHTLEHLYADQVAHLLRELYRTMLPGAWIRITVPDLKKYISFYLGEKVHENFERWNTGCEALRTLTQDNYHLSLWDAELMTRYLSMSGFINVKEVEFMQGSDTALLKDKAERRWETLYMEAQKPLSS